MWFLGEYKATIKTCFLIVCCTYAPATLTFERALREREGMCIGNSELSILHNWFHSALFCQCVYAE